MTKEKYYEMCEAIGSNPVDSEIPVGFEDLPYEAQEAYSVYNILQDTWDSMSGTYLGKNLTGLLDIFNILEIEESRKDILRIIMMIDSIRAEILSKSKKETAEK